jgi:alanyl-tRNA synthetase
MLAARDWVANGREVSSREVSLAEAKAIKGLRAVFGEVRRRQGEGGTRGLL